MLRLESIFVQTSRPINISECSVFAVN